MRRAAAQQELPAHGGDVPRDICETAILGQLCECPLEIPEKLTIRTLFEFPRLSVRFSCKTCAHVACNPHMAQVLKG
eukprot:2702442-Amphidinium_carterae.1